MNDDPIAYFLTWVTYGTWLPGDERGWVEYRHVANCRTNHNHAVITAQQVKPKLIRDQVKAWCTRRLNEHQAASKTKPDECRTKWWAERGSIRWVWTMESLADVVDMPASSKKITGGFLMSEGLVAGPLVLPHVAGG